MMASFSPLFIGEATSSDPSTHDLADKPEVSVPSSSGKPLHPIFSTLEPPISPVSFPSSSWKPLHLHAILKSITTYRCELNYFYASFSIDQIHVRFAKTPVPFRAPI